MNIYKKLLVFAGFIIAIYLFIVYSSKVRTIGKEGKYRTEIRVHYSIGHTKVYTYYTDNKVDVCSFNGTNYLIEDNNKEELLSTTAPIEIINQSKFDKDGNEHECEIPYYNGSN